MFVPPIPDRIDFASIAEKYFKQTGNAIEIGVWAGDYARYNLNFWSGTYYMCDAWSHRPEDAKKQLWDRNGTSQDEWNTIKEAAISNTSFAVDRVKIVQSFSADAAKIFPDKYFDWIYLDAMHDYDNVKQDLICWWPKLRDGGIFSGDDYGLSQECSLDPTMTPERFTKKCGYDATSSENRWGTLNALCEFSYDNNLILQGTWLNDTHNPSWYIIKN
jgi:hypothetical protein